MTSITYPPKPEYYKKAVSFLKPAAISLAVASLVACSGNSAQLPAKPVAETEQQASGKAASPTLVPLQAMKMERKAKVARYNSGLMLGRSVTPMSMSQDHASAHQLPPLNEEVYNQINENPFQVSMAHPVSTFSIDVDTAAYSNVRRFINSGRLPMKDAVRIEELVNYFNYDYPYPTGDQPFSIQTEVTTAPWNKKNKLVQIGLQGKNIPLDNLPASNLVFLIDVSGSMGDDLALVKSAMTKLAKTLRPKDKVAIVVYAGAAGLVLPSTSDSDKIISALNKLQAGGSTAGAAGIKLAYQTAMQNFITDGNNRVIIATDGDFNVGTRSQTDLERLIKSKASKGVFLSVLGFGYSNYNDAIAETLADKGNGNYSYIDSEQEAKKVLVNQMAGTLYTIAKDVKIQVQFNPLHVKEYRLIGYENRMLRREDFDNDKKDAGEIGVKHTVTALYEIVPVDTDAQQQAKGDSLDYVDTQLNTQNKHDLMSIRLRYKQPDASKSQLLSLRVPASKFSASPSDNMQFASAVAEFGLILRDSPNKANANMQSVIQRAQAAKGEDKNGYRQGFVKLAQQAQQLLITKTSAIKPETTQPTEKYQASNQPR